MYEPDYDFTEEAIRDLVEIRHVPDEVLYGGRVSINCQQCYQPWPCPPLQRLRKWRQETGKLD